MSEWQPIETAPTKERMMLAYLNDVALKSRLVDGVAEHAAADRMVKGRYWEGGKGCSVGCAAETLGIAEHDDHAALALATGIPEMLWRLNDGFFEALPDAESQLWPMRFAAAITPGADLSLVGWQFLDRVLRRAFARIDADNPVHAGCADALAIVSAKSRGVAVTSYAAWAARDTAGAASYAAGAAQNAAQAARYAAQAARDAAQAARYAAQAARYAAQAASYAAYSAQNAAYSARDAAQAASYAAWAARYAVGVAEIAQQADDLCELLAAAPVSK